VGNKVKNKEILEKAIQKAIDGGWNMGMVDWPRYLSVGGNPKELIFQHDFAKALWGERDHACLMDYTEDHEHCCESVNEYEYHFQQMVIADDPIKYLGENI
jgi:hypothetical protein